MENLYSIAERYAESGLDDSFLFNVGLSALKISALILFALV